MIYLQAKRHALAWQEFSIRFPRRETDAHGVDPAELSIMPGAAFPTLPAVHRAGAG